MKTRVLRRAALAFVVGMALLSGCDFGIGTVSGPADEPNPLSADLGPQLDYYVAEKDFAGHSTVAGGLLGRSVALGDFNGDGRLDIAAGAPRRESGRVFIRQSYGRRDYFNYSFSLPSVGVRPYGGDDFGWSLAAGDFNGDGFADLAVGAPRRDVDDIDSAGEAFVLYGSRNLGLAHHNMTRITQGRGRSQDGMCEPGDLLGWSLAAGDFNADGYADLAIGAPGEDYDGKRDAGAVLVRWGSASGLQRETGRTLLVHPEPQVDSQFGFALASVQFLSWWLYDGHRLSDLMVSSPFRDVTEYSVTEHRDLTYRDAGEVMLFPGSPTERDALPDSDRYTDRITDEPYFGWSLAAGHFDGGDREQLAVGAPHWTNGVGYVAIIGYPEKRVLYRLYQSGDGLSRDSVWSLGLWEEQDDFGSALAASDWNGDGFDDLAIGAPDENWHGVDVGLVYIRFGTSTGLWEEEAYFLSQGLGAGRREAGDYFGTALASGDLENDGDDDLVIGSPGEDIERSGQDYEDAGAFFVALSRAPERGPFEGCWTGTVDGDSGSSAEVVVSLRDRDHVVRGDAEVLSPGFIVNLPDICGGAKRTGGQSINIDTQTAAEDPGSLTYSEDARADGFDITLTLHLTLSRDLETMAGVLEIDTLICDEYPYEVDLTKDCASPEPCPCR